MKHLLLIAACILAVNLSAQSLWKEIKIKDINLRSDQEVRELPRYYNAYELKINYISRQLSEAPHEDISINIQSDLIINLPLSDGKLHAFRIYESPVMAAGLAQKYRSIKTYKGVGVDDASMNVRIDITPNGLHAAIHTINNITYIDPYASLNTKHYLAYDVKHDAYGLPNHIPMCGVDHAISPRLNHKKKKSRNNVIPLRKYRIAIACTGEYGKWKGSKEKAMADIVTGLNRMNQVFENEASIRYELVDNNEKLLHLDPDTDPYVSTTSGGSMLSVNTNIISNAIGINSYDLGHVYSRSCDVGGVALLGSLCNQNIKGAGVTCHYGSDLNFFAVSVTAHEIGHQMSANHSFNNCTGEGNENLGTGMEPGSGSTIMSYASLCGSNNVQSVAYDNYHNISLQEIYNHSRRSIANECGEKENFNNHEPVITLPELYKKELYIPTETYFYLEGSATDSDNDTLTYSWEGMNSGPLSPLGTPLGDAPRFKVYAPTTNNVRYFPRRQDIFNSKKTITEILPVESQKFLFNLTVRDNHHSGGTAVWDGMSFRSHKTSGKFGITSPNESGISKKMGDTIELKWEVADTDKAPINCPLVDIYFSTYKSTEFDINSLILLEEGVPNDGSHILTLPFARTDRGRFVLKSRDNIFFDISKRGMQVLAPEAPSIYATASPLYQKLCIPDMTTVTVQADVYGDSLSHDITLSIDGLPEGTIATFEKETIKSGESTTLSLDFSNVLVTDIYQPRIMFTSATADTFYRALTLDLVASNFSDLKAIAPVTGASGISGAPIFTWSSAQFGETYDFEVSDSPAFTSTIESAYNTTDTSYASNVIFDKSKVYYWRVRTKNNCGSSDYIAIQAFSTAVLSCEELTAANLPLSISQSGTPTVEAEFNVLTNGTIADVNVKLLEGDHSLNKDLVAKLISPKGTEITLFQNICSQRNFKCGFDDESNTPVKCPLGRGNTYRPKQKLSTFNNENPVGVWKIAISDTKPGNGGKLKNAVLELCANVTVENPKQEVLNPLNASTNAQGNVGPWHMTFSDDQTPTKELIYTIVTAPKLGKLYRWDTELTVGSTFSQDDIDVLAINYRTTDLEGADVASFTINDGQGGWAGIFDLDISIKSSNPVSTKEAQASEAVTLYPNPTNRFVRVTMDNIVLKDAVLMDIQGRVLKKINKIRNGESIDLSALNSGMYILQAKTDDAIISKRIVLKK